MCKFKKDNLYTLEAFIKEQMQQLKMVNKFVMNNIKFNATLSP